MLVLTRKLMERLVIGDNICITVVRIEGGQVRLGIEAPPEVRIVRSLDPTFGLDREAVAAVKQWRFAPALRQGQPVPVLVPIEVSFTLR